MTLKSFTHFFTSKWWSLLLFTNILFVLLTVVSLHMPNFWQKWRIIDPFTLWGENTIAVWWSGMTLFLAGILFFDRYKTSDQNKISWLLLSMIMVGLSLDEIGSIHERVAMAVGWIGFAPFAIVLGGCALFSLFNLYNTSSSRKNAISIFIGFSLYASVSLQELVEHAYTWPAWAIGIRSGTEEGTELIATLFMIFGAINNKHENKPNSFRSLLPDLATLNSLTTVAILLLVVHIIGTYLFLLVDNPYHRGNPLVWFPVCLNFCSFLLCVNYLQNGNPDINWKLLTVINLVSSIGLMTNLFVILLPQVGKWLTADLILEKYLVFYLIQYIQLGMICTKLMSRKPSLLVLALALVLTSLYSVFWIQSLWLQYCVLGLFAMVVLVLLTNFSKWIKIPNQQF